MIWHLRMLSDICQILIHSFVFYISAYTSLAPFWAAAVQPPAVSASLGAFDWSSSPAVTLRRCVALRHRMPEALWQRVNTVCGTAPHCSVRLAAYGVLAASRGEHDVPVGTCDEGAVGARQLLEVPSSRAARSWLLEMRPVRPAASAADRSRIGMCVMVRASPVKMFLVSQAACATRRRQTWVVSCTTSPPLSFLDPK